MTVAEVVDRIVLMCTASVIELLACTEGNVEDTKYRQF